MSWIQLTSKRAQSLYGIPLEIANATENKFFGIPIELPREYDALRPLLALIRDKKRSDMVTLHIKTLHPESWEYEGKLLNPLSTDIGGYLDLDKGTLADLITILGSYQKELSSSKLGRNRQVFEKIKDSKLVDFRLQPELFPNTKREYYIQTYEPSLVNPDKDKVVTILIFSRTVGFSTVFWSIVQFMFQELQEPKFKPLDRGHSRINLDRNGMQELIVLLQKEIDYLG